MNFRVLCKITLIVALFIPLTVSCGGGTFSEGYRAGTLSVFEVQGCGPGRHGEGQLLLGSNSSESHRAEKQINPWYFSAGPEMYLELQSLAGQKVVIEYVETRWIGCSFRNTKYIVQKVYPIITDPLTVNEFGKKDEGLKGSGMRFGRIVKTSHKGQLAKSWEIIFQEGYGGNSFKEMSITDRGLYDFALELLKRQVPVTIDYKKEMLPNFFSQDTAYEVTYLKAHQE